jgi:hypothetical protein
MCYGRRFFVGERIAGARRPSSRAAEIRNVVVDGMPIRTLRQCVSWQRRKDYTVRGSEATNKFIRGFSICRQGGHAAKRSGNRP